jgi:ubiquinone/menaquinone biosynthesis C-methylase UbiE
MTTQIEKSNVIDTYNIIADTFNGTRYKPWPSVVKFIEELNSGTKCLEVGCGNAKNMFRDDIDMIGIDTSEKLIEIGRKKGKNVSLGDGCDIKYTDDFFDSVISIAVLHHVFTEERRIKFIQEMIRVCKPGGKIMIEVWATSDPKFETSPKLEHKDASDNDRMVSFLSKTTKITYDRYYHFFSKEEFEILIKKSSLKSKTIEGEFFFESNNWIFRGGIKTIS